MASCASPSPDCAIGSEIATRRELGIRVISTVARSLLQRDDMFARARVVRCLWLKLLHSGGSVESGLDTEQRLVVRAHARQSRGAEPLGWREATPIAPSSRREPETALGPTLLIALGLVLCACSGSSDDEGAIWKGDSTGIEFELTGATAQRLCEFSATRVELTQAQLDGLASLRLQHAAARAACDTPSYSVTIHGGNGSSVTYQATHVGCSSSPILLFEDFDAWAKDSPCSLQP
jgi:hypothetical protein